MPIIFSVNGNVESYPASPLLSKAARVESVGASADAPSEEPGRRSTQLVREAYEQQTRQTGFTRITVLAQDLMTSPVVTLGSDGTLTEAWELMKLKGFRHLPVTSLHGTLVGVVSDRDLLRQVPDFLVSKMAVIAASRRLAEIISPRLISATPTTDIREIARVMAEEDIRAVPILDWNRCPIGIITTTDLLHGLARHIPLELWT